jgi:hypothetical protein
LQQFSNVNAGNINVNEKGRNQLVRS